MTCRERYPEGLLAGHSTRPPSSSIFECHLSPVESHQKAGRRQSSLASNLYLRPAGPLSRRWVLMRMSLVDVQRLTVTGVFELVTVNTSVVPPRSTVGAGAPSAVAPVFVETCQIFPPAETEYA
jgi:hypothetical protein